VNELLVAIRESPLSYLPEVSLSQLFLFRRAYAERRKMHGRPYQWGVKGNRFGPWVRNKFQILPSAIELSEPVILSFSNDERDAFYKFFELLDEFERLDLQELEPSLESRRKVLQAPSPLKAFAEALRTDKDHLWSQSDLLPAIMGSRDAEPPAVKSLIDIIRHPQKKLPGNYLEVRTFRGFCAYLMGDCRAYEDLQLVPDDQRLALKAFERWVESNKNRASPRPWHRVILYSSQFRDCNTCSGSAFSLFCDWLDEYAAEIGKPDLFQFRTVEANER
jgi:hypothetical protein